MTYLKTLPFSSSRIEIVMPATGPLSSAARYLKDILQRNLTEAAIVATDYNVLTPNTHAKAGVFAYGAFVVGSTH